MLLEILNKMLNYCKIVRIPMPLQKLFIGSEIEDTYEKMAAN
jgi:hypothetical protein